MSITIAGGGLAGLSLAVGLARRQIPVILHEAQSYPRHRVCGEFILGLTSEIIDTLGLEPALADARSHTRSRWYARGKCLGEVALPYPARGISRFTLDARLQALAVELGAQIQTNSRMDTVTEASPGLVLAHGRRKAAESKWLGLKAHFLNYPMQEGLEMHLGKGGYVGICPVESGAVNVCGLLPVLPISAKNRKERLLEHFSAVGLEKLAETLSRCELVEGSLVGVSQFALGTHPPALETPLVACVGDQLGIIPPFTGAGMSMAFESAALALPPLVQYSQNELAWPETCRAVSTAQHRAFRRRMSLAAALHPWVVGPLRQRLLGWAFQKGLLPFGWLTHRLRTP